MNRDFESPVQDADIEMADLEREAGRIARLRKAGFCDHGWFHAPEGQPAKCYYCGKVFANAEELLADGKENTL